ncbi:MAG TPA: cysteine desulfurase-like protein [Actinobacteria bacterium]|nr:cysteine desulfurase-like protein [Actinomycetota bacterium]
MSAKPLDVAAVRSRFPALMRPGAGAFLDGPGGTQVSDSVIAAISGALEAGIGNLGGAFEASGHSEAIVAAARSAVADLFDATPDEVVFGPNMTTLTFAVSRALARRWVPGDEIVVTRLDHDANVTPWRLAAADRGVRVRTVEFDAADGTLDVAGFHAALGPRTRLVAVTAASNALGTVTPLADLVAAAHEVGALVYVDAVHHSAHRLLSLRGLGADLIAASAYKFFGPHIGMLVGRRDLLESEDPYKLVPAHDHGPDRWETGTQSFEALAGVAAAIDYLASLGEGADRRSRLETAFGAIRTHETALAERFLTGVGEMPRVRLFGITDPGRLEDRVATFALEVEGVHPRVVAERLGERGLYVWDGDYYAVGVMDRLGKAPDGLVRVGFVHYNTADEVDRVLAALDEL